MKLSIPKKSEKTRSTGEVAKEFGLSSSRVINYALSNGLVTPPLNYGRGINNLTEEQYQKLREAFKAKAENPYRATHFLRIYGWVHKNLKEKLRRAGVDGVQVGKSVLYSEEDVKKIKKYYGASKWNAKKSKIS